MNTKINIVSLQTLTRPYYTVDTLLCTYMHIYYGTLNFAMTLLTLSTIMTSPCDGVQLLPLSRHSTSIQTARSLSLHCNHGDLPPANTM